MTALKQYLIQNKVYDREDIKMSIKVVFINLDDGELERLTDYLLSGIKSHIRSSKIRNIFNIK